MCLSPVNSLRAVLSRWHCVPPRSFLKSCGISHLVNQYQDLKGNFQPHRYSKHYQICILHNEGSSSANAYTALTISAKLYRRSMLRLGMSFSNSFLRFVSVKVTIGTPSFQFLPLNTRTSCASESNRGGQESQDHHRAMA